ncbi:hypothetical protein CCP4SC76_7640011 [Gammaproteobacteria bacterium]
MTKGEMVGMPNIQSVMTGMFSNLNMANEISDLRKGIAALRADMFPSPGQIMVGRQVLNEYRNLQRRKIDV